MAIFGRNKELSGKFPSMTPDVRAIFAGDLAQMALILADEKPAKRKRGVQTAGRALSEAVPAHVVNPYSFV